MTTFRRLRSMPAVGAAQAFRLAVPLAAATALWVVLVRALGAGGANGSPSFLVDWSSAAALALPGVFAAAWSGLRLARRVLGPEGDASRLGRTGTSAIVGLSTSVAVAFGVAFQERLFHTQSPLPLPVFVLRDALLALPVAVAVASAVAAIGLRERHGFRLRPVHAVVGLGAVVAAAVLGGSTVEAAGLAAGSPCPSTATVKQFYVQAIDV